MRTAAPKLLVMIAVSLMTSHVARAEISWESDLRTAHQKAAAENKLLLLHFYSDNCIWCDENNRNSWLGYISFRICIRLPNWWS